MKELKPCPFCGGEAEVTHEIDGFCTVECVKCGALVDGIDAWNTRAELTCRDLGGCDEAGMQVFNCSECGCVLSLFDVSGTNTLCTSHIYDYPRFCPNCGAKVGR